MAKFVPSAAELNLVYDPQDPRLFFSRGSLSDSSFVVLGYPDDEGIKKNGGRPGAALAPDQIRNVFFKMTPNLNGAPVQFCDIGNFSETGTLSQKQKSAANSITDFYQQSKKIITFGGGHDWGYPDSSAFVDFFKDQNPLVVNFDAHLDVRPLREEPTSGTPFFQLLSETSAVEFVEVGIQSHCNSAHHLKWAKEKGAKVILLDDVRDLKQSLKESFVRLNIDTRANRPCFISVDIDCFSSSVAPGCSQSWATGLMPPEFFDLFQHLLQSFDVRGLGVYEVSPPLDSDNQTSKLAALIAHRFLHAGTTR